MTSRLNRRQRRQVEAIKKRVSTTRINKLVEANEESIEELKSKSESFLRSGIDPKRVAAMTRRLENTVSRARDLAAKTEEFIRTRVDPRVDVPEESTALEASTTLDALDLGTSIAMAKTANLIDSPRLKARLGPIAGFSMTGDLQAATDNILEKERRPTFADLLLDDPETMTKPLPPDKEKYRTAYEMDMRTARMAQRLVAGLLLAMQNTENFKDRAVEAKRSKNKRAPGSPAHRLIHVGRPLNIDLRPNIESYIRTGKTGTRRGGPPTVQVLVRGHYKRQAYGVGRLLRKVIWIEPFWRGPEEAIINVRPKLKAD
jgi:hypothetical protein